MKSIQIDKFGGPEVLVIKDIEIAKPGPKEVLIKNKSIASASRHSASSCTPTNSAKIKTQTLAHHKRVRRCCLLSNPD